MASLQQRGAAFRCLFRFQGKQHALNLGKVTQTIADAKVAKVDELLALVERGVMQIPPGVEIVPWLEHDGKTPPAGQGVTTGNTTRPTTVTLGELRDAYLETQGKAQEVSTLTTARIHFGHLVTTLGANYPIGQLDVVTLQRHIDRRASSIRHGKPISETTIRKELATLRSAWIWGSKRGTVPHQFPADGLTFPKGVDKPPFKTLDEVRRRLTTACHNPTERAAVCEALYLQPTEVGELLTVVRERAAHPWIYPMACLAAHTGARRSELIRLRVADVNFADNAVTIHERKRVKGKASQRIAPLSVRARAALQAWLKQHPGGEALFTHGPEVVRSSKRSPTTGHQNGADRPTTTAGRQACIQFRPFSETRPEPLTPNEVHDHFARTIRGTKFALVRGLHVLRHSFISGLAESGTDQRVIDDIVGHTSEEMRRRYRHLTPQAKAHAVASVFNH